MAASRNAVLINCVALTILVCSALLLAMFSWVTLFAFRDIAEVVCCRPLPIRIAPDRQIAFLSAIVGLTFASLYILRKSAAKEEWRIGYWSSVASVGLMCANIAFYLGVNAGLFRGG